MMFTAPARFALTLIAVASVAKADFFANFFDDAACSQNGGIGVDIRNPGCLGEAGRGSVFIPNTGLGTTDDNQFCLVITHGDGSCSCQSSSNTFTATGFCKVLDPSDQSYRFISGACAANNC
ncbi:hypothetical protein B0H16DRAFT_1596574 [Mycena metata]|uniref:Uncharacterized protein n=1 Tax=Mycena metata TaxID=1033252 RepID=A0AAD7HN49_9AGAR|nr:hypothetical protein B0H16DRAFT_1596570 [Mycena metata]KAJ7724392.1 hypothetical protein B0H16DRAFT_1596574 [Mycena metata]